MALTKEQIKMAKAKKVGYILGYLQAYNHQVKEAKAELESQLKQAALQMGLDPLSAETYAKYAKVTPDQEVILTPGEQAEIVARADKKVSDELMADDTGIPEEVKAAIVGAATSEAIEDQATQAEAAAMVQDLSETLKDPKAVLNQVLTNPNANVGGIVQEAEIPVQDEIPETESNSVAKQAAAMLIFNDINKIHTKVALMHVAEELRQFALSKDGITKEAAAGMLVKLAQEIIKDSVNPDARVEEMSQVGADPSKPVEEGTSITKEDKKDLEETMNDDLENAVEKSMPKANPTTTENGEPKNTSDETAATPDDTVKSADAEIDQVLKDIKNILNNL